MWLFYAKQSVYWEAVPVFKMIGLWKIKMSQGLLMSEREMRMKKLFGYAEKYIARCGWKDLAMLKFCLFAMGVLAGMRIPVKNRKQAGWIAAAVFAATYVPLMAKFFFVIREKEE